MNDVHVYRRRWWWLWLRRCDVDGKRTCVLAKAAADKRRWGQGWQW